MIGRLRLIVGLTVLALAVAAPGRFALASEGVKPAGHETPKAEAEPAGRGADAAAHGGGEAKSNPMEVQPSLALWTFVVFLGLMFVLGKYAWGPLSKALHEREEHIEHALLQTEKARTEAEELLAEHRRLMAQADEKVRSLLDEAQRNAQATAEGIVKSAQAEAESARVRATREISSARDQALAEIWSQTANVAVSVAGRVLSKELGGDDHRRLLDAAIRELPAAPASANGAGRGGVRS